MQSFEPFAVTFEDGVKAGDGLLALIVELNPGLKNRCDEFLSKEQLQPINDFIVQRSGRYPYPYLEGFFSRVVKATELEGEIISLWGADEFIENQTQYAPICNMHSNAKFFQFASWTGDMCDGDAWCIDLEDQLIRCLTVTGGDEDMAVVRANTYGVYTSFDYLISHLRCSAARRGWLDS